MKRKLVLIFEDNKLLHATLTERGRRVKLPKIITNEDALAKVKDTLTDALSVVGAAIIPTTTNTAFTSPAGLNNQGWSFNPTGPLHASSATSVEASVETAPVSSIQEVPRARSVCARPKKDEKSPTIAPCS
jgi:hypothetical protein